MSERPTPQQVRRALARAERGAALDVAEATALLAATGAELDRLTSAAARVRDAGLTDAGRPGVVTFSPKVFIPVTRLCRDRCHYCTFVETPAQAARACREPYLSPDDILAIARDGAELGCLEALFTLGDRPEDRWPEARTWLDERGYDSTLAYVRAMAVRVLEETGLLPHLNPGVLSWTELNRLKPVAPSMGMMLETTSRRLFETKGAAHYGSPDKDPAVRLRVLEDAGRLSVPFTSGLLVGIGEGLTERAETIFALRRTARAYGAIQEVIVQNFRAKPDTAMRHSDDLALEEYRAAIAVTRLVLGPTARVQAPPNLVDLEECRALLDAGVDDWGGVSPLTPDHVNPERPWPSLERLREVSAAGGFALRARLTIHPEYVVGALQRGEPWLDPRVRATWRRWPATTGSRGPAYARRGCRGRSPTAVSTSPPIGAGPHRPARRRRCDRSRPRTGAATSPTSTATGRRCGRPRRASPDEARELGGIWCFRGLSALRAAPTDPGELSDEHALTLMTAEGDLLRQVCGSPTTCVARRSGDEVTYVVNRNINFTNVCYVGCRFCAFAQRRTDADAYSLSSTQVADRARRRGTRGHRDLHAGRHRPRPARRRVLRPGARGQERRRTCTCTPSPRWRWSTAPPGRAVDRGVPAQGTRGRARHACPARRRRSSTTTCAGC